MFGLTQAHGLGAIFRELDARNTVLVTSAGNFGHKTMQINAYPALLAQAAHVPNMIVVGASTMDGRQASFSQIGTVLSTYGPGHGLTLADPNNPIGFKVSSGTSYCKSVCD